MTLFSRKGCSFVPDLNFKRCCDAHDELYEVGGTEEDREFADAKLEADMFSDYLRFSPWTWFFLIPWCTFWGVVYYAGTLVFKKLGRFNYLFAFV